MRIQRENILKLLRAVPGKVTLQKATGIMTWENEHYLQAARHNANKSPSRPQAARMLLENPWHRLPWVCGLVWCYAPMLTQWVNLLEDSCSYISVLLFMWSTSVQIHQTSISKERLLMFLCICLLDLFGGCNRIPDTWPQVSLDLVSIAPQNMHSFTQTFS